MTIDEIIKRLQNVASTGTDQWQASCPCAANHAHGDKKPSLSVKYDRKTGKILFNCKTGCTFDEICAALGITARDLMPDNMPNTNRQSMNDFLQWYAKENALTVDAVYSYCYDQHRDGLCKVRFHDAEGEKTFRWIRPDTSTKSGYKMNRDGCQHRLYVAGNLADNTVFLVEGEKDADNLHRIMQRTVVCGESGGAKSPGEKWRHCPT